MQASIASIACFTAPMESETVQLVPIWQEDAHYIHYRCLLISTILDNVEQMLEDFNHDRQSEILDNLEIIRINLGQPKRIPTEKKILDSSRLHNDSKKH